MTSESGHPVPITYDPRGSRIVISHLEISDPEIVTEAHHWSEGRRGVAVTDDQLAEADLGPFVRLALATGVRAISAAAGSTEIASHQRLITELGDRAEASSQRAADRIGQAPMRPRRRLGSRATRRARSSPKRPTRCARTCGSR